MSGDGPVNLAASVHARLKNVGRDTKRDFNVLLIRYALERFLYRISRSEYCDSFVLMNFALFFKMTRKGKYFEGQIKGLKDSKKYLFFLN